MGPITIPFVLLVVAGPLRSRVQSDMNACNKEVEVEMGFALKKAVVSHLRKYFFYPPSVRIECGVVNFFCWEPALGAVALDTIRQWPVNQGA